MKKKKSIAEKIGRELLCWGKTACICFHSEDAHICSGCDGLAGPNLDIDCQCTEYHPKDNLLFLESKFTRSRRGR